MVSVEQTTDPVASSQSCADLFSSDAIGCNMVAGALAMGHDGLLLRAADGDRTLGAAVAWDPGFTLTRLHPGAAEPLADALPVDHELRLAGEVRDVATVAGRWSEQTDGSIETDQIFRIYRLGRLRQPDVAGRLAIAEAEGIERAASWATGFGEDTGLTTDLETAVAQMTRAVDSGRLLTWEVDGEAVAQLLVSIEAFGVVRIGGVYTPPELRGRGYAAALTAAVSEMQRARPEVDEVILNTQADNALTNRLYRRLGFESVFDMLILWVRPGGS